MDVSIESTWKSVLADEFNQPYFVALADFVRSAYRQGPVFPPAKLIFNAFDHCPLNVVKVVIIGQDPYHGPGQAHGLAFSVPDGVAIPPSLRNIYKEIANDTNTTSPASGNLERWATQGVLLLNATLTVLPGQAGSHQGKGWEQFTDSVIATISREREHIVFLLWGAFARSKVPLIDASKHLILEAAHPSPLSAHNGFLGCKHFSKANEYLEHHGYAPIVW